MSKAFAYYPGCSSMGTSLEYDLSCRALCNALDVQIQEVPDWTCCGSTPAHVTDLGLSGALAGRNLAQAWKAGYRRLLTACPACLKNLKSALHHAREPEHGPRIEKILGQPVPQDMEASSVLEALFREVGPSGIRERVRAPLAGLKVACYYGCLLTRPEAIMRFDDPENPTSMDLLLEAAGAQVLDYPHKVECCGASLAIARKDVVMRLSARILEAGIEAGADVLAVACPLCHMNLDLRQRQVGRQSRAVRRRRLPVVYFTQLLGLALGLDKSRLGFDKLAVNPDQALARLCAGRASGNARPEPARRPSCE